MKKLLLFLPVFFIVQCKAQNIPVVIKNAFSKSFPNITVKKWDKENGNYEANFIKENKSMSATFAANGMWMETETDIKITELPPVITAYIKTHYNGVSIKEAAVISNTTSKKLYEAEIKNKDLLFDDKGNFVKEEAD